MTKKEKQTAPKHLKHSLSTQLALGSVPALAILLDIYAWMTTGTFNMAFFAVSATLLVAVILWIGGETITLKKKKLVHTRFFVFSEEIKKADIEKSVAVTRRQLDARPHERLEVFLDNEHKAPDHVINLKLFSKQQLKQLFSWLPNLDADSFDKPFARKF